MTDHAPPPSAVAATIAAGGTPVWEQTFRHRIHGELTFRAEMPTSRKSLAHRVALDALLAELGDGAMARSGTLILAGAIAGLELVDGVTGEARMVMLPELTGQRTTTSTEHGEVVTKKWYDAGEEPDEEFLYDVWIAFSAYRNQVLGELDAVKGL